ncbi:MAG: hypothetical protein ACRC62_27560 [Microcoleus sp.]
MGSQRKKEEGRRKKEEARGKRQEARGKRQEGGGKREEPADSKRCRDRDLTWNLGRLTQQSAVTADCRSIE